MKILRTSKKLTWIACVVAFVMSTFSFRSGVFHVFETRDAHMQFFGKQELLTTLVMVYFTCMLYLALNRGWPAKTCMAFSFLAAASSCFSLANLVAHILMMMSFMGWAQVVADEGHGRKMRIEQMQQKFKLLPRIEIEPLFPRLGNYLASFVGFYGLTLALSIVVAVHQALELDEKPMEIRIAKASARGYQLTLIMCVLPALQYMLPYMTRMFYFMPKKWRIKDKHLHHRIVKLGNTYAVIHVLAHFSAWTSRTACNFDLLCLQPYAWISGYFLVWTYVLVYVLSASHDLRQDFYRIHRIGHVVFMVLFLIHMPEIGYWLLVVALLCLLDLWLRWRLIDNAKIALCEVFPGGGYSHLCVDTMRSNTNALTVSMAYIQILSISKQFKPFTVFRLPGEPPNKLHFMIKTHAGGWTHELEKSIREEKTVHVNTTLYLDGPHVTLSDKHHSFTNLLLFASGIGATVVLSMLGCIVPGTSSYLCFEWALRVTELQTFLPVIQILRDWKRISFPQLYLRINVSGCKFGNRLAMEPNLTWLFQLAESKEYFNVFDIHVGRTDFNKVFASTKSKVERGRVGVFGCGSDEYCNSIVAEANQYFAGPVSFHCNLESV